MKSCNSLKNSGSCLPPGQRRNNRQPVPLTAPTKNQSQTTCYLRRNALTDQAALVTAIQWRNAVRVQRRGVKRIRHAIVVVVGIAGIALAIAISILLIIIRYRWAIVRLGRYRWCAGWTRQECRSTANGNITCRAVRSTCTKGADILGCAITNLVSIRILLAGDDRIRQCPGLQRQGGSEDQQAGGKQAGKG